MSDGNILWMQWMDRENHTVVLCDSVASTISGPWSVNDIDFDPVDPIVLLRMEALYTACISHEE